MSCAQRFLFCANFNIRTANIKISYKFHFAIFSAQSQGSSELAPALQTLINSPYTTAEVKPILQRIAWALYVTGSCISQKNKQCLENANEFVYIPEMKQAIASSSGPLKQLFQRLLKLFQKADTRTSSLPKNAGDTGANTLDGVLLAAATQIKQFLGFSD